MGTSPRAEIPQHFLRRTEDTILVFLKNSFYAFIVQRDGDEHWDVQAQRRRMLVQRIANYSECSSCLFIFFNLFSNNQSELSRNFGRENKIIKDTWNYIGNLKAYINRYSRICFATYRAKVAYIYQIKNELVKRTLSNMRKSSLIQLIWENFYISSQISLTMLLITF